MPLVDLPHRYIKIISMFLDHLSGPVIASLILLFKVSNVRKHESALVAISAILDTLTLENLPLDS